MLAKMRKRDAELIRLAGEEHKSVPDDALPPVECVSRSVNYK
jgi:hypothetical protein